MDATVTPAPSCRFSPPRECFVPQRREANWPYGNLRVHDGRIHLLYMEVEKHLKVDPTDPQDVNGDTWIVSKPVDRLDDPYDPPRLVKAGGPGLRPAPGTLGICPNGDFITVIHPFRPVAERSIPLFRQDRPGLLMRSADQGDTWTESTWVDEAGDPISCLYIQDFVRLSTGRSLLFTASFDRNERVFYHSDDPACRTWVRGEPLDIAPWVDRPNAGNVTEASVLELPDGRLLATFRRRFGAGGSGLLLSASSADGGISWTALRETTVEAAGNNGILSLDPSATTVRLLSCSRSAADPGIFLQTATVDQAVAGRYGPRTRIVAGVASGDFGNPAQVRLPDGRELIVYYSTPGSASHTAHFELHGTIG